MGTDILHTDIAIIGGGIAGLWALNQLRNRGYSALLFEQEALGSLQTIGSQGMIHGGIKYALAGAWSGSSEAISSMPGIWRDCLEGRGKVDLRGSEVLSEDFYLWSSANLQSRLSSFFASKLLRGRVERVKPADHPAPLRDPAFQGQVYRLIDLVLDVPSLVSTLAGRHRDAIFQVDWKTASLQCENGRARLALPHCTVQPERLLLTAGTGNEALIQALGGSAPAMQRRPLQQLLLKHQYQESFFAHCMGGNPSPRLTISSHRTRAGEPVWYLGGDLATEGADDEPAVLIDKARIELGELLPWIDFGQTEWRTIRLDRAEPRQSALLRPDSAFVGKVDSVDNTLVAWPTKLSLSPNLADEIERELETDNIVPHHRPDLSPLAHLGRPPIARAYWDTLFQ
jgi:glycine/D-amino acid oxidase-like deaminating enzyme